ncbi:MAG: transglutaminase-like domain-containing protein [Marinilabiliaceae bacterium]|nr:transglutaminase-like domain-containing protein [Marinilabiliaceae bacterium]
MRNFLYLLVVLGCGINLNSQPTNFSADAIPNELKKNAYAVVRYESSEFIYKSEKSGVEKHSVYITVLNKKGENFGYFNYSGDKFRELKDFTGTLYDKKGKKIKKFKKSDLRFTELSSHLADDGKHYFFSFDAPSFPFTVHYTYEVNWNKGIFVFPNFAPQPGYNISVEKAIYNLTIPETLNIRLKALNFNDLQENITHQKRIINREWTAANIPAIESEQYSPSVRNMMPILFVSPETFTYDGVKGTITDWNSFGKWIKGLQEERDKLPDDLKTKIIEMTKNAKNDYEKVRILYDYLGETTRYVSIQLGIGGFQSMPASEVYKVGFGDCKALSNYLQSMLKVIGIESNYIVIRSDNQVKTLMYDYPSFNEMNHAILQVPLEKDTLWLECTNTNVPFGFIHNGIVGHNALEVSQTGGRFCKLPDYPDSLNANNNYAVILLNSEGYAEVNSTKEYAVKQYNAGFVKLKHSEQNDRIRSYITLPNAEVKNLKIIDDKSPLPLLTINYDWTTPAYGTKTGNRLFIPVNPFRSQYSWIQKNNRINDIEFVSGVLYSDSIYIIIPEEYEIETLPTSNIEKSHYGTFETQIVPDDKGILIKQTLYRPSGYYNVEEYQSIKSFFEIVNKAYNEKITLRRK